MGEPSVEEILESIKKVIARDNRSDAEQRRRQRPSNARSEASDRPREVRPTIADVLELTETADLDSADLNNADLDNDRGRDDSYASELDEELEEGAVEMSEDRSAADHGNGADPAADSPLLAANAQASMRESLAALAMLAEPGARPQIVRSGETSLEGLTRELLRPMLAQWLDQNLPPMVERLVAAEIKRIVGKRD